MQYGKKHHREVTAQAAGAVIFNERNEVLLVQELNGSKKGLWHIPSGTVEHHEFPQQAAVREIKEETGLVVRLEQYLKTYVGQFDDGALILRHAWVVHISNNSKLVPEFSHEIGKVKFHTLEEVNALYKESKLRMHHTYLMVNDAFTMLGQQA